MDHAQLVGELGRQREVFRALLEGSVEPEIRWKPAPEQWCLLEIVCHLHDEEREDFRARLEHVLETPEAPMPPIHPSEWVTSRRYMEQDFATMLGRFLAERDGSIAWLRGLVDPPWTNAYAHPKAGPLSGTRFLVNWVAHDMHHIRQINNLRHAYLAGISPEPLDYAGDW